METKQFTVTRTVTKYIAQDGEKFDSRWECMEHERKLKSRTALEKVKAIPQFDDDPPFSGADEEWRWYYVSSQQDVDHIAAAFFHADSIAHEFRPKSFPCWIAAVFDATEADSGWMLEYAEYAAEQEEFNQRLIAKLEQAVENLKKVEK